MAAPTVTPRTTPPAGVKLEDGFKTLIAFAADPDISFWEKSVKPPGIDGGDAIDETTMHNTAWRTRSPRALKTLTDSTVTAQYDPKVYTQIEALVNVRGAITVHFPDNSSLAFYGFLQKFEPGELKEGDPPEASITIIPTNYDPVNHVEAAPVYTSPAGTAA
jgi:hypothetical protein